MRLAGMWLHWLAIVLLIGPAFAGFIGNEIAAALIVGVGAMLVAEIHVGLFDEILDAFRGDDDEYEYVFDETRDYDDYADPFE